ncbi:MAG: VacJ family lipoprotein [Alphaproteobacteria bacterium]|jgi:phospholipid-binding lipoprotein MlaA|nr:VacJ family lipoprotein [Alphaproteobacteria bacterium]
MRKSVVFFGLAALALAACAGPAAQKTGLTTTYDPFEGYNRAVTKLNTKVNTAVVHPALKGYRVVVPRPARKGLSNVLYNLRFPVIVANQTLQGDWQGAHDAGARGIVNTILGVGGLFDVASAGGIPKEDEDFGQTLAVWGVPAGPYIVTPLLGPSSLRAYTGYAVDGAANPLNMYLRNTDQRGLSYTRMGVGYLNLREKTMDGVEALERSSLDPYAALRSAYYQTRAAAIRDDFPGIRTMPDIPEMEEE